MAFTLLSNEGILVPLGSTVCSLTIGAIRCWIFWFDDPSLVSCR
jgi:hypothetical protein